MKITLTPTEPDEKLRYPNGPVTVEGSLGVLIANDLSKKRTDIHQWGGIPECFAILSNFQTQLAIETSRIMAANVLQEHIRATQAAAEDAAIRRHIGADAKKGLVLHA